MLFQIVGSADRARTSRALQPAILPVFSRGRKNTGELRRNHVVINLEARGNLSPLCHRY